MKTKIDKQLLEIYKDLDLIELEYLSDCPEYIETGENYQTDGVVAEHLKTINYLIKKNEEEKSKIRFKPLKENETSL